ncbi:hypothetical protein BB560_002189 [Smittium megazygosporum]|uniref:Uncharacterized protein n=1 Tax=Smittium megazygosporum TaxID=133381 RepID=A0A2T9ZFH9_9FUNG|nr:hypothetical protein BB560_002189 [Smittium megazygosporum]
MQQPMEFRPSETTVQENYINEYVAEHLSAIIIILSILLESEEKSLDASSCKAKLGLRGIEQDNHQHLGSERINPGIQNLILHASSNYGQAKVENSTLKQEQKKWDRNRSFKPPHKESYRGGDLQPVLNIRPLNKYVTNRSFKMIRKGDYMSNIDPQDKFLHILKNGPKNFEGKDKESQKGGGEVDQIWKSKNKEPCFLHRKSSSNGNWFISWSIDAKTTSRPQEQRYKEHEILKKGIRDIFPSNRDSSLVER